MSAKDAPPQVVEATRVPRTTPHHGGLLTRIKNPRAHWGPARRAVVVTCVFGTLLTVLATVGTWPAIDDCLLAVHARGTPEHTELHADDKHSQVVFILLLHATYIGLVASTWMESGDGGAGRAGSSAWRAGSIALFWILDAALTYAWRVAVYLYVVRPLGLGIPGTNCGTSKVISGHTHFYCFHLLQLGYILVWDSRPFLPPRPNKPTPVLGDSGDPRFMAWLVSMCVNLYAVVVMLWTVGTLQQTYMLGFHSLRHMIAGLAAACFTFASLVRLILCPFQILGLKRLCQKAKTDD